MPTPGTPTTTVDVAAALMSEMARPCGDNRYVVLSDGGAALGPWGPEATAARILETAAAGPTWSGITLGQGLRPAERLEGVAWLGHGHHGYADTPHEADRVLGAMLQTSSVVGRDLRLKVDLGGVSARPLHPEARLSIHVDELWSSGHQSMLFEVAAPSSTLSPSVTWEVGSPAPGEWTRGGQVGASALDQPDPDLAIAWAVTELARSAQRHSVPLAYWEHLFGLVRGAGRDHPVDTELLALIARAAGLTAGPAPPPPPP